MLGAASGYGEQFAGVYDTWFSDDRVPTEPCVELLTRCCPGKTALELGIGTGRVAIPLSDRGIRVTGIDASEAMLAKLRTKPGASRVTTILGDFSDVAVGGSFSLVYVVLNTLFLLPSQEAQVRCIARVAQWLDPDGIFVVEAFVPDPARFTRGMSVGVEDIDMDHVVVEFSRNDALAQRVTTAHVVFSESVVRSYTTSLRYAWPAELDLMAGLAGLRLVTRLGGYDGRPFTRNSTYHVSCYAKDHYVHAD